MMQFRGATGELRWAYLPAAVFGPWRLETDPAGASLEASVVSVDEYRITQQPLTARCYVGRQTLAYAVESVTVQDGRLSARLQRIQQGER